MAAQPGEQAGQPDGPPEVYGAAPERTALAWQRTGLGVIVGSFLVFQTSLRLRVPAVGYVALVLGVLVTVLALAFPRQRFVRGEPADSWLVLSGIAAVVVLLAVLGGIVAILTLLR